MANIGLFDYMFGHPWPGRLKELTDSSPDIDPDMFWNDISTVQAALETLIQENNEQDEDDCPLIVDGNFGPDYMLASGIPNAGMLAIDMAGELEWYFPHIPEGNTGPTYPDKEQLPWQIYEFMRSMLLYGVVNEGISSIAPNKGEIKFMHDQLMAGKLLLAKRSILFMLAGPGAYKSSTNETTDKEIYLLRRREIDQYAGDDEQVIRPAFFNAIDRLVDAKVGPTVASSMLQGIQIEDYDRLGLMELDNEVILFNVGDVVAQRAPDDYKSGNICFYSRKKGETQELSHIMSKLIVEFNRECGHLFMTGEEVHRVTAQSLMQLIMVHPYYDHDLDLMTHPSASLPETRDRDGIAAYLIRAFETMSLTGKDAWEFYSNMFYLNLEDDTFLNPRYQKHQDLEDIAFSEEAGISRHPLESCYHQLHPEPPFDSLETVKSVWELVSNAFTVDIRNHDVSGNENRLAGLKQLALDSMFIRLDPDGKRAVASTINDFFRFRIPGYAYIHIEGEREPDHTLLRERISQLNDYMLRVLRNPGDAGVARCSMFLDCYTRLPDEHEGAAEFLDPFMRGEFGSYSKEDRDMLLILHHNVYIASLCVGDGSDRVDHRPVEAARQSLKLSLPLILDYLDLDHDPRSILGIIGGLNRIMDDYNPYAWRTLYRLMDDNPDMRQAIGDYMSLVLNPLESAAKDKLIAIAYK